MILQQADKDKAIRIFVSGFGWGGPRFAMSLDEAKSDDIMKEVDNIRFVVDKNLDDQFSNIIVDYRKSLFGSGFVISLDGTRGSC